MIGWIVVGLLVYWVGAVVTYTVLEINHWTAEGRFVGSILWPFTVPAMFVMWLVSYPTLWLRDVIYDVVEAWTGKKL